MSIFHLINWITMEHNYRNSSFHDKFCLDVLNVMH